MARPLVEAEAEYSPDTVVFSPDFWENSELVKLRHLNTFHQISLLKKDRQLDGFLEYKEDSPPNGLAVTCTLEGICCWSKTTQQYFLMYPMCGLQRLFHQCKRQVLQECEEKLKVLTQGTTIQYRIPNNSLDIVHRNLSPFQGVLVSSMMETYNLKIDQCELESPPSAVVTLKCSFQFQLKFKDGMCLGKNCTKNAIMKGPEVNELWRGHYCQDHGARNLLFFQEAKAIRDAQRRLELLMQSFQIEKDLCLTINDALDGIDKEVHLEHISAITAAEENQR